MTTHSLIRYLLSDKISLSEYCSGATVSLDAVKRRLLLLLREKDKNVPDHYYRLVQEKSLTGINSLSELLQKGLYELANDHLELRGKRIYVKQEQQLNWQELISLIPPLVLIAAFLYGHDESPAVDLSNITDYFNERILPNTRNTALLSPYVPQLEYFATQQQGFHDLHIHLNGSTEVDRAWQDFLEKPEDVYRQLQNAERNEFVKEQFETEIILAKALDFRNILFYTRHIRNNFYDFLFCKSPVKTIHEILTDNQDASSFKHPFANIAQSEDFPLATECLMYVLVFHELETHRRESAASLFHFYLLMLGLANRLLVQQTHQNGFQQFQKITKNKLRDESEKSYRHRFFQLAGNDLQHFAFIEGRFAPKKSEAENIRLIDDIEKGWKCFKKNFELPSPELKLVAHFIKEKEDNQSDTVRFRNLRYQTEQKAVQLALLKRNQPSYCKRIVGIDAAASEFDTPPEVFAPAFRYLKRNGFKHFTYHAGEDFYHILGGLRAIYEAIDFCGLSNGDRIGHGVATGISTKLWTERIGKTLLMRQGDYLDDLLFARHLITTEKNQNTDFVALIPLINSKISTLSWQIYKENVSVDTLDIVWKLRKYSPAILCGQHSDQLNELLEILKVLNIAANEIRCTDERIRLLCMYHQREHRQKCNKIIEVETEEFFSTDQLTLLQLIMLDFMHRKEIVIETLPSSNVRVGVHCNFDTYHLWNWYQWKKQGHPIPPIVIGTDDAGIFATNIYNEYANVYCNLTVTHKVSHDDAMNIIKQIDENSRIYRFENYTTYTKNEKE